MHPDLVTEYYRHYVRRIERDAEIKRLLADARPERRRFRNLVQAVQGLRRRRPPRTVAAAARACH